MTAPIVTPCDQHPVIWGRCPTCGVTIAMTRQLPQGACFSGGAAYAHHMPRSAYTGQPDESRACLRCGDDVEAGDDEPTRPGGELGPLYTGSLVDFVDLVGIDWPAPTPGTQGPMRTLQVGGETWVVKA